MNFLSHPQLLFCTLYIYFFLNVILRAIQERAESVRKKIGEKLTPEIRNSLKNAVSLEEVEEVVGEGLD